MQKITITFASTMVAEEAIDLTTSGNSLIMRGVDDYTGEANTFEIGSNATESAANYASAITSHNALYNVFGPTNILATGSSVEVVFVNTSITSSSTDYIGATSVISEVTTTLSDDIYDYDQQIFTRSPHFFNVESANSADIESAELQIYIYSGSRYSGRPAKPTYVVRSSATLSDSNYLTFNVSELAKSFTSNAPVSSGSLVNLIPYIDIFPFYTQDGKNYSLPPSLGIAYNGYGYFEDGGNPQSSTALAQSNNLIIARDNFAFNIPIFWDKTERLIFESRGQTVKVEEISGSPTFATMPIANYTGGFLASDVPVELAGEIIPSKDKYNIDAVNCFRNTSGNEQIDKVHIETRDGDIEVVNVRYINEGKYSPVKLIFVNKFGAFQEVNFFKNSSVSLKTEVDSFRRNTRGLASPLGLVADGYATTNHQYKNLYRSGKESISLNSGFYPEEYNEVFRQLMLSEDVWMIYRDKVLPVNISDSSMEFKTKLNEKLIEYSVKCDFAYDAINSIS